ncbi:MAG: 4Fe-4S ferredoxin [Deltaproteobacteria bacterium]|nr:MAG: 4Fe-4S ferredoxin [Deltaproteobacteria bacterium]
MPTTITIDEKACWGCRTCELACKQEMRSAVGVRLIVVGEDGPRIENGKPVFTYRVHMCRHCDDPPCADVCPEDAISKRADGIVVLDDTLCSGCRACIAACPYDAIDFDADRDVAQKCNLCHHRVDQGLVPACADNICLAHCIGFRSSPDSLT